MITVLIILFVVQIPLALSLGKYFKAMRRG